MNDITLKNIQNIELEIMDEVKKICENNNLEYYLIAGSLIGAVRHNGFIPWDDDLDIAMPRKDYERFLEICNKELGNEFILDYHKTNKSYWLPMAKIRKKNTVYEEDTLKRYNGPKGIWIDILPLDNAKSEKNIIKSFQGYIVSKIRVINTGKINEYDRNKRYLKRLIFNLFKVVPIYWLENIQQYIMNLYSKNNNCKYYVIFASRYGHKKQTFLKSDFYPPKNIKFEDRNYNIPNNYDYILKRVYGDYMKLPSEEQRENHNPSKIII